MTDYAYANRLTGTGTSVDYNAFLLLLGRLCFGFDFILFGMRKFANPPVIAGSIERLYHLPGQLVYPTIVLQVIGGLCLLLGLQTRFWAANFAWFCIVAPSFYWTNHLHNLTFDYGTAGGFLLLFLFGPGPISLDAKLRGMPDVVARYVPAVVNNRTFVDRVALVARALIAVPFLADVVKKIVLMSSERALFASKGIPADAVYLVMLIELVCGLAVLFGWRTRLAAVVLIAWTLVLGFVINNPGYDLAIFGSRFVAAMQANWDNRLASTFFKDITVIGALLMLLVYGPGRLVWNARAAEAA